ncbi:MAG: CaiB/BaiF CoA-transferase family protein [bacterium]|nr:CaiB/BaiF CoA-transferase family protein [bacterium]
MPGSGGPLEGVRVIEACQVMAGPFCACLLGDMGADVIKVEKPGGGDDARLIGRHFAGDDGFGFMNLNRNKRSIVVNFKDEEGQAIVRELVASADIFIQNMRPGTIEKLGLGYEALKEINPGLVYVSISGYGRTGPYKDRPGFDLVSQGFSSLMSFTGEPNRPPAKIPVPICDLNAGMYSAFSALSAYIYKQKTGKGQLVDVSLTDAGLGYTFWQASQFFPSGDSPYPRGSAHELTAPYQAFRCADGHIVLGAANQSNWGRMCRAIGREDLMAREEYSNSKNRGLNYLLLAEELEAVFLTGTRAEWLAKLEKAGVPCGPIHNMAEAFAHPQIQAREMSVEVEHPVAGKMQVLGFPPKLSETRAGVRGPAPLLGQHTDEILRAAGKGAAEIQRLRDQGVVS